MKGVWCALARLGAELSGVDGGAGGGGDYFEGGRGGLRGDGLFYQVIVKLLHNPVCPRDGLGLK